MLRIGYLLTAALAVAAIDIGHAAEEDDTGEGTGATGWAVDRPYFAGRDYSVAPGDTLWDLAGRHYVVPYYWPHIWNRNRALPDPDRIRVDQVLRLPTLQGPPGALTAADRRSIAEGYLRLYDHFRSRGEPNPEYALVGARYYDPSVLPPRLRATATGGAGTAGALAEAPAEAGPGSDDPASGATAAAPPANPASPEADAEAGGAAATPAADERSGIALGGFRLNAGLGLSRSHDDNLFAARSDPESAPYTSAGPWLSLESDWERHAVALDARAETADFTGHPEEDYTDGSLRLEGRYDLDAGSNVFGSLSAARDHEDRTAVNRPGAAAEPTVYRERQAVLGTARRLGEAELRVGITGNELDFDDVPLTVGGSANNDDRDRETYELGGRVTRLRPGGWQPFAQAALNERTYDAERDDLGFARSSAGASVAFGATRAVSGGYAELFAGYMEQDYDDARFGTVESPDIGARLSTVLTGRTKLRLQADRSIEETTIAGAAATVDTVASARLEHRMSARSSVSVPTYWVRSEFERVSRADEVTGFGLNVRYRMARHFSLYAGHTFERRDSTVPSADYEKGTSFAGLAAELAPAPVAPLAAGGTSGPYVGVQGGTTMLGTEVSGPRGPTGGGGSVEAEIGTWRGFAGAFAGYGWAQDRWLVALELEADDGEGSWKHDREPRGNDFSLTRHRSYAGSARLGYWLDSAALLYGRAGLAKTEYRAEYEAGSGDSADLTEKPRGVRFGAGMELALSDRWFGRLDWSYTDYHPIDVDYGTATDEFSPTEQMVSLGLGYRFFDGGSRRAPSRGVEDLDGAYVGAGLGRGTFHTDNTGDQRGSSGTGTLDVDRADGGTALAAYGGYGRRLLGPLYLGAELELEGSDADWASARLPDRRVYGVRRGSAYGLALRAGYVIDGAALMYLRAGRMRTEVDTDYEFAGEDVDVADERTLDGDRIGIGVEVPASEHAFVRLDYSYTDYDSYSIDYATSTGTGTETFDNDEDRFLIGGGYRF